MAARGRSPVTARSSTMYSGTEAISSAASPDATCCWASATSPLPQAGSSSPDSAVVASWARVIRNARRPAPATTIRASSVPPIRNRTPPISSGGTVAMISRLAR